jgi:uncharacterized protein YoxC
MIELRGAIRGLKELLKTTESSLKPTLVEFQQTLKGVRVLTENVANVTEDIQVFSGSVKEVGENVKMVSGSVKHVSDFIEEITSSTGLEVSGLRAGIKTALKVFLKNLFRQK